MTDREAAFSNLHKRATEPPDITERDGELLVEFAEQLDLRWATYSTARKAKLLNHPGIVAKDCGDVAPILDDRERAEHVVAWVDREYPNESTNRDCRPVLRSRRYVNDRGETRPVDD